MTDPNERIIKRLTRATDGLEPFKNKVHRLRTIVAGDPDALRGLGVSADITETDVKRAFTAIRGDIFVDSIEEGRSNKLLQAIRTLAQQTSANFPEVEFDDLEFEEANLHAEYLRQRLGPPPIGCDAVNHMRRALYDYLTGGYGWVWIGMQNGKPIVRSVDTLDCKWDQSAPTVADGRWWSATMYGTFAGWSREFGAQKMRSYTALEGSEDDKPVELEYYYDLDSGKSGAFRVMLRTGDDNQYDPVPVLQAQNPCRWTYGGREVPHLPAEALFFMEVPSVRLPLGLVEQMLPDQIALWRVEAAIREIVDCPAFYDVEEDTHNATELQKFRDGKTGRFLTRKKGSAPPVQMEALEIPLSLIQWQATHTTNLQGQGGADPYASGAPLQGVKNIPEVMAIRASSGLMPGTIVKDNTAFWIRMIRKFLAKGATSDEWPLVVRHEDVDLLFDESDPIRQYLKPDAKLTVREDTMVYQDQATKMQLAKMDVDTAVAVNTAAGGLFPNALKEAYQNYLGARGEKNVDKYLKPPEAPMGAPMGPQGAPVAPVTGP
jgi:hypothetical protein